LPDTRDEILSESLWESHVVRDAPHWFERCRVVRESWNDMPVDVGELVAEEFIVDLPGVENLRECFRKEIDLLHQLNPLRRSQMKQLCRVAFEQDDGPAWKELVVVQIGLGEAEVGNEMVFFGPAALASFASWIFHG
jgi:hypothetical protein